MPMKKVPLKDLFDVSYGNSLELNSLTPDSAGINFVSRSASNNGVSARVKPIAGLAPAPAGTITVAAGGSVMESFLQPTPYYTAYHVYSLNPRIPMTDAQKLFYCVCLRANRFRFNYGRQANRTIKDILVPAPATIPTWVNDARVHEMDSNREPLHKAPVVLSARKWRWFTLSDFFEIEIGRGPTTRRAVRVGRTPHISTTRKNNGISYFCDADPTHPGGVLTVANDGSVGQTFFQPLPFVASYKVNVLTPKSNVSMGALFFIGALISREKYRYSYGRKWGIERMRAERIKLPIRPDGAPDWKYMDTFINSLPYSSTVFKNTSAE